MRFPRMFWVLSVLVSGLVVLGCSGSSSTSGESSTGTVSENGTGNGGGSGTDVTGTDVTGSDVTGDGTSDGADTSDQNKADGTMCAYGDEEPHPCACADGLDNDGDGLTDGDDLHCFGPFDDDEGTYATGIPGDNKGSKANRECPFDGNSGTGNDAVCCEIDNPELNVTPNGCDDKGCCEIDVNGNSTGEFVYVADQCFFSPVCGTDGTHGCECTSPNDCDLGQFCVLDKDVGPGFCSTCEPCQSNEACANPCDCGEKCFGGFERPESECGTAVTPGDSDPGGSGTDAGGGGDTITTDTDSGLTGSCPGGRNTCTQDSDCDGAAGENCVSGCCYARCSDGLVPCDVSSDCQGGFYCVTGCCIRAPV